MNRSFSSYSTIVAQSHAKKLAYHSGDRKLPISRLIAFAIDNELAKDKPFDNFPRELPTEESEEYAYADEAGKVLRYLQEAGGMGIDLLMIARKDIGVEDIPTLLAAVKECLTKDMIQMYQPINRTAANEHAVYYRVSSKIKKSNKAIRKRATEYEKFKKLEKKYKDK